MLYRNYRRIATTGDLLFFSGKGAVSAAIKRFTFSKWDHVAMVVCQGLDLLALWESTTMSDVRDIESGRFVRGVQTVPLSLRLEKFAGEVGVRRLREPRPFADIDLLARLRHEFSGRPYEESACELFRSAYDGPLGANERDVSSLFCSELVAEVLQAWKLLPGDPPSNEYTPSDLAGEDVTFGYLETEPLILHEKE